MEVVLWVATIDFWGMPAIPDIKCVGVYSGCWVQAYELRKIVSTPLLR